MLPLGLQHTERFSLDNKTEATSTEEIHHVIFPNLVSISGIDL